MSFDKIPFYEVPFDKMPFYKMSYNKVPLHKMSFDKMSFDKMSFDKMSFDKMPFDKMSYDKVFFGDLKCWVATTTGGSFIFENDDIVWADRREKIRFRFLCKGRIICQ
jgi:hypothetical protein